MSIEKSGIQSTNSTFQLSPLSRFGASSLQMDLSSSENDAAENETDTSDPLSDGQLFIEKKPGKYGSDEWGDEICARCDRHADTFDGNVKKDVSHGNTDDC